LFSAKSRKSKDSKILVITDVICSESEIKSALKHAISFCNDVVVFTFIDGKNSPYNYITVDNSIKQNQFLLCSIFHDEIETSIQLPESVYYKDVIYIDDKTKLPTSYNFGNLLPDYSCGREDILDVALRNKAILTGHIESNTSKKHFSTLLDINTLFSDQYMKDELFRWLKNSEQELRNMKYDNKDSRYIYIYDFPFLLQSILYNFFKENGYINVNALPLRSTGPLADQFTAQFTDASPNNRIVCWIILPFMSTGGSFQKAIEHISKEKTKIENIYTSILISRLPKESTLFYSKINKYKDIDLSINFFGHFPIQCYVDEGCPLCAMSNKIESLIDLPPSLGSLVNERKEYFTLINFNYEDNFDKIVNNNPSLETLKIKQAYENAIKEDLQSTNDLSELIDADTSKCRLFEIIGRDYLSTKYSREKWDTLIYKSKIFFEDNMELILSDLSLFKLLGVYKIYPDWIKTNFYKLLNRYIDNKDTERFNDLIFLSLLHFNVFYSYFICIMDKIQSNYVKTFYSQLNDIQLLSENKQYKINDIPTVINNTMELVTHCSIFNQPMLNIRQSLSCNKPNYELIKEFSSENGGLDLLMNKILKVIKHRETPNEVESVWDIIKKHDPHIEDHVNALIKNKKILNNPYKVEYKDLITIFQEIYDIADRINTAYKNLFLNVLELKIDLEVKNESLINLSRFTSLDSLNKRGVFYSKLVVDRSFPGIFFDKVSLFYGINAFLKNANEFAELNPDLIEKGSQMDFIFSGLSNDGNRAILTVADNLPWPGLLIPRGGIRTFLNKCELYFAHYELFDSFSYKKVISKVGLSNESKPEKKIAVYFNILRERKNSTNQLLTPVALTGDVTK
jgi:hypothetical protein